MAILEGWEDGEGVRDSRTGYGQSTKAKEDDFQKSDISELPKIERKHTCRIYEEEEILN